MITPTDNYQDVTNKTFATYIREQIAACRLHHQRLAAFVTSGLPRSSPAACRFHHQRLAAKLISGLPLNSSAARRLTKRLAAIITSGLLAAKLSG